MDTRKYLEGGGELESLKDTYGSVANEAEAVGLEVDFHQAWSSVEDIQTLRDENAEFQAQFIELTKASALEELDDLERFGGAKRSQ